jgi:hypothetical protein
MFLPSLYCGPETWLVPKLSQRLLFIFFHINFTRGFAMLDGEPSF